MANRGGIGIVTCGIDFNCGQVLTDSLMTQVYQTALSAYNRGDTVVNQTADVSHGNTFSAMIGYSPNRGEQKFRALLQMQWDVENPGYNKFVLSSRFRFQTPTINATGLGGTASLHIDQIKYRYQTSAGSQDLLTLSVSSPNIVASDPSVGPWPENASQGVEYNFCVKGTLANLPPQSQSEVGYIIIEVTTRTGYVPELSDGDGFDFDTGENSYVGVASVMLKFYGDC